MRVAQEFQALDNYGSEAPNMKRVFVEPAVVSCSANDFTWMLDSKGIVWITCGADPSVLESPCLPYCLGHIHNKHPFVDIDAISKMVFTLQKP